MKYVDPYSPLARMLPIAEKAQGLVLCGMRKGIERIVREIGARRVFDVGCGSGGLLCHSF